MRLFLDANVLFTAAHNPRGKAALVIELGRQGHWDLYSSAYALEEARRNLRTAHESAGNHLRCSCPDGGRLFVLTGFPEVRDLDHGRRQRVYGGPAWGVDLRRSPPRDQEREAPLRGRRRRCGTP